MPLPIVALGTALTYALQLMDLIQAGVMVAGQVEQAINAVRKMRAERRGPTDEEWSLLNAESAAIHAANQK